MHWNTDTPLIPPIHTRVVSERPPSVTSALTHILPEHAHLVKGGVPSVEIVSDEEDKLHDHAHDAAENLPVPPLSDDDEEENLPVPRLADEDDIIFLKSHNTSDPIVRCRDQGAAEGLDTGGWEVGEELEVQHWIGGSSPPSTAVTAVGKGQQGKVTSGFAIPGAVTTDRTQKRVTDYFPDTPSPTQLRERAQRVLDQRKALKVAAEAHQALKYTLLREAGARSMAAQERAWQAAERQAQRLREQADEEQAVVADQSPCLFPADSLS